MVESIGRERYHHYGMEKPAKAKHDTFRGMHFHLSKHPRQATLSKLLDTISDQKMHDGLIAKPASLAKLKENVHHVRLEIEKARLELEKADPHTTVEAIKLHERLSKSEKKLHTLKTLESKLEHLYREAIMAIYNSRSKLNREEQALSEKLLRDIREGKMSISGLLE